MKLKRIAFTGLAKSGKSTAADYCVGRHKFHRISYAAPMKRMLRCMLIESGAGLLQAVEMVDGKLKETPTKFLCGKSPRHALQTLGTEWARDLISQDIWRRILLHKVELQAPHAVVVDDLRFADEAADLRGAGFTIIRMRRKGCGTASAHVSEDQDFDADITLDNDDDVSSLHDRLNELIR
jgi:hypothetical protein